MKERKFNTGTLELSYVETANDGVPLLLLHGGSSRWQTFQSLIPDLEKHSRIYALDLRGHGKSDRGGNDDTLNTLVCLDKSISSKCDVELPNGVALYDSVTEVSAIYQTMVGFLNQHENVYDFFEYNEDIRRFQSLQDSNLTMPTS